MPSQILLFSQARSASHMLVRMFEKQNSLKVLWHPFSSSRGIQLDWMRSKSYADGMSGEAMSNFDSEVEKAIENWRIQLSETEQKGQMLMVHTALYNPLSPDVLLEHFNSAKNGNTKASKAHNCTMIPDDLLLHPGTIPIFTTRDPRLTIPSTHRTLQRMDIAHAGGELNYFSVTCPIWSRIMYDFYKSRGVEPLVIDADDYILNEELVHAVCSRVGLVPEQQQMSWPAATEEEKKNIHPMYYASQSTLINSSKPEPAHAARNKDLEVEVQLWDREFGDDAATMRELVDLAQPHFQYLWERRMIV